MQESIRERPYTELFVRETPKREVCFTSGKTIYLERLVGDRWVSGYWAANGHLAPLRWPQERWYEEDAFQVEIDWEPLSTGWQWVSGVEVPEAEKGYRHFVVELSNTERPITLKIHTLLDGSPVLTRWLEITNISGKPVALTRVCPWSGWLWPRDHDFTLGYFTKSDWAWEGWLDWESLSRGITSIKCDKGQGHDDPFFIVRNEAKGEYFIGHLAWSANWQMEFERKASTIESESSTTHAGLLFRIGPWASSPQRVIAPRETVTTPAVHLGHIEGDLDTVVQAMHDHLRRSVYPPFGPERSHLVQVLVPGDNDSYLTIEPGADKNAEFNETNIFKAIDVAVALGVELFILDAQWWDISGDWVPSRSRFPHGLKAVSDYIRKKGLLFGLYVETEGGRGPMEKSKMGREHPDWLLGSKKILDLTKSECAAWMEAEICRIIDEYKLDLYRIDYNPMFTFEGPSTPRDGFLENNYWRYYEAFYAMYERIQNKYPNLILQQCAAGGARNDLGTTSRFHEIYLTDGLWMPHVLRNYSGQTLGQPPERFIICIGAPGWKGHLDSYLRSTFTLSTPQIAWGPAPDVKQLNPLVRDRFIHYANLYKEFIRPLLPTCKMYHHAPISSRSGVTSSGWFAMEFASPDRTKGWAIIIRIGKSESDEYLFLPRGLDPGRTYRVTFDASGSVATIEGYRLMHHGLLIRREALMSSELFLFKAE